MSNNDIYQLANILRPCSAEVSSGKSKLCLSSNYLKKLNKVIEENNEEVLSCFQPNSTKTSKVRDVQFLLDLVQRTAHLKINPDVVNDVTDVDIVLFKNIRSLEIQKLEIQSVVGIQRLRPQLQELTCCYSLKELGDVLDKCGGDNSQRYTWRDLRRANFSHNGLIEIDSSLDSTVSLHTLDLSHNELKNPNFINCLPNLKYLNLSYNKLIYIPHFKGQICSRLQILILNNNFIEDIAGLILLTNITQLDISQNSLIEHKSLLYVSHLISLQYLNLSGNPLSFHPNHRNLTCNCLNKNASSVKFLLDGTLLSKSEKALTGSLCPMLQNRLSDSSNNSLESSTSSIQEKPRKVRNVMIADANEVIVEEVTPVLTPSLSSQHLTIKKQVEQLREEYGESWLYRDAGLIVQDVLGFEKSMILSSTPSESAIDTLCIPNSCNSDEFMTPNTTNDDFKSANEESIFNSVVKAEDEISDISDGEDIFSGGEESIYLVTNEANGIQMFVVLTERHISERDVNTSKEKARWHINTIIECEKIESNVIKLVFDTVRRDRKQRIYEIEHSEMDSFFNTVTEKLNSGQDENKKLTYQCMKCSHSFTRKNEIKFLSLSVTCPKCNSNLVVESS